MLRSNRGATLDQFDALQDTLGVPFDDITLLRQAMVHRSYLNENPDFELPSNERLEFLGDALLGFVIAEKLFTEFPHLSEGDMTKLRAALVRGETLARLAATLRLGDYLYMGWGEEASGGRCRLSTLAAAFEAVVGAILIDQGFAGARDFVIKLFAGEVDNAMEKMLTLDYKSRLQEVIQAQHHVIPVYRTVRAVGPEHAKEFTVEVIVAGSVIGRGHGSSKRMAEKEAARDALEGLLQD